jgi:transposase
MKKPGAPRQEEKTQIDQLSQAELVELVLGLQKIIEELQEKLAIATGKSRTTSSDFIKTSINGSHPKTRETNSQTRSRPKKETRWKTRSSGKNPKRVWTSRQKRN